MSADVNHGIEARFQTGFPGFRLDVDLELPGSGFSVLFGPSGCGKTTLLRCIAGLHRARGHLRVNGALWQDERHFLPVHRRALGYVFQETSLFAHRSVRGNLEYGWRRVPRRQRRIAFDQVVDWLGLGALIERDPAGLSGGQRQRVAIGRALLASPDLLLMDEPLSALDLDSRRAILPYLEGLRDELDMPVIYVTHSPDSVARLADRLVIIDDGRVLANGPVGETLARLDLPVHRSLEAGVALDAEVVERDRDWQLARVQFDGGSLWVRDEGRTVSSRMRLRILARDVSLSLVEPERTSILNVLPALVSEVAAHDHPSQMLVKLHIGATPLLARVTARSADALGLAPGKAVWAQVKSVAVVE
ncbi:MAG TPA: molybdenum ABC transporter ATP-binding protein [Wenzhouxiangella sp.]|nr:molybdenum ABC transporter ATP-binding protein [Wenzhouxiangella sp.]